MAAQRTFCRLQRGRRLRPGKPAPLGFAVSRARNPSTIIYIAHITTVELTCAIARRRKGKTITAAKASSTCYRRFDQHIAGRYTVIGVTPALLEQAKALGRNGSLAPTTPFNSPWRLEASRYHRGKGSAPVILISADQALNNAALAEGLAVDDPAKHP